MGTFAEKVYDAVKRIPKGRVATYGQIAEIIGCPGGSRAVGNALHVNPYAPVVPCHRVVAADGSLAAHYGGGGPTLQYRRLEAENVVFLDSMHVDLSKCGLVIENHKFLDMARESPESEEEPEEEGLFTRQGLKRPGWRHRTP